MDKINEEKKEKEKKEEIDANGFQQKWILDPQGYFLIRINKEKRRIEVGHCTNDKQIVNIIHGGNPESIMYKVIDLGIVSLLDHAAYLGKELQKADLALKFNYEYVQDSDLIIKRE